MFGDIYHGKKVLVTGNTGFKGSWLTVWLLKLGAEVIGLSKDIPTKPAMFNVLNLSGNIKYINADIRDLASVKKIIDEESPDFIFHLAAQAIVSTAYTDPLDTMSTNIMGTINILEALRFYTKRCAAILITSDKCYDNVEWVWGYRETDKVGGKDIYSGSKGAAELVIKSYVASFFQNEHPVRIAVGRAGNVIGGGDWASDRIVADCMRAWSDNKTVNIRSPMATRPWQHVLEPLSGYLLLGKAIYEDGTLHSEAFNFGPRAEQNHTVIQLLSDLGKSFGHGNHEESYNITDDIPFDEAGLLKLNCDKALFYINWEPNLKYEEMILLVGDWYRSFFSNSSDMLDFTKQQVESYEDIAIERNRIWAGIHG